MQRIRRTSTIGRCTMALVLASLATGRASADEAPVPLATLEQSLERATVQGDPAAIEAAARRLLDRQRAALGQDARPTVETIYTLANALNAQRRPAEAEPLLREALAIEQAQVGAEHVDTGIAWFRLGIAVDRQRRYKEAETMFRRALAIRAPLGDKDAVSGFIYANLGVNLAAQDRPVEAEAADRRAIAIDKVALGPTAGGTGNAINTLASLLDRQGKHAEAEPLFREALAIMQAAHGERHVGTYSTWLNLARNLDAQGKTTDAEPAFRKALALAPAVLGDADPETAEVAGLLAANLERQARFADAEPFRRQALLLRRAVLGEQTPLTALSLGDLAGNLRAQGRPADAEPYIRQAIASAVAGAGKDSVPVASLNLTLAGIVGDQGRYREAEALLRETLAIYRTKLGETGDGPATACNNLAANLGVQGRYADAEAMQRKAIAALEAPGKNGTAPATYYANLAEMIDKQGRPAEAEPLFRRAIALADATDGADSVAAAAPRAALAGHLARLGRFAEAETALQAVVERRRAVLGPNHPSTMTAEFALAYAIDGQGRYAESERRLRDLLARYRTVYGDNHPKTADALNSLALNLDGRGKYGEAEALYRQSIAIFAGSDGSESEAASVTYGNMAATLGHQGRYAEAEPLYRRALAISQKLFGEASPTTAFAYGNLGANLGTQRKTAEAEAVDRKAVAIDLASIGPDHPDTAAHQSNLASVLIEQSKFAEAEALFARSLAVTEARLGAAHPDTGAAAARLGYALDQQGRDAAAEPLFRRALAIRRKALGERHPDTAISYSQLAVNLNKQPKRGPALAVAAKARAAFETVLRDQPDAPLGRINATRPDGSVELVEKPAYAFGNYLNIAYAGRPAGTRPGDDAFAAAQRLVDSASGRAMAFAAARTAAGTGPLAGLVREQQDLSGRITALDARIVSTYAKGTAADIARLRTEQAEVARQLAAANVRIDREFPAYRAIISPQPASLAQVRAALAPDEGVLLLLTTGEHVYSFAVSRRGVAWHSPPATSTATMLARIARLRCQVDPQGCTTPATPGAAKTPYEARDYPRYDLAAANALYADLVAPVEGALRGVKTLYVSTAGPLADLPLHMLVTAPPAPGDDDADPAVLARTPWLADRYALAFLPSVSGLKLARLGQRPAAALPFSAYGDPVLHGDPKACLRSVRAFRGGTADGLPVADPKALDSLCPLPGSGRELAAMAALFGAADRVHLEMAATETAVKGDSQLATSRIIAFATHGALAGEGRSLGFEEPGLVLTPPAKASPLDDGVLTASEASQLSLSADWVILSACNTASAEGGDGADSLSALARGFLYAGANALLASHWRVSDDATAALTVEALALHVREPTLGRAAVLQRAMHVVRSGRRDDSSALPGWNDGWSHPQAWAPFTTIEYADRATPADTAARR